MEERIAVQLIFKEKIRIRRGLHSKYQCGEEQGAQFSRSVSRVADIVTSSFDQECLPNLSGDVAVIQFGSSRKWARGESV